jgi:hypothetical protein
MVVSPINYTMVDRYETHFKSVLVKVLYIRILEKKKHVVQK